MKKYKVGDIIEGKITGIESYGIFVSFTNGYDGLIHISEISNSFVKNINDYASLNETIKTKIIEIDEEKKRYKLTIKNLHYNDNDISFTDSKKNGFTSLKNNLQPWIDEAMDKINKN